MNKIMKRFLITGLSLLVIGIIIGLFGYYQGGQANGLNKAYQNDRIEFNF